LPETLISVLSSFN